VLNKKKDAIAYGDIKEKNIRKIGYVQNTEYVEERESQSDRECEREGKA
jgi:hypothetical protein